MADESQRITISRDVLRADLAEMELRLRIYFDDQLRHKAEKAQFTELAIKFDRMDRGEFTEVHRRALVDLIEDLTVERTNKSWTGRERLLAALSGIVAISTFILTATITIRGGV